MNNKKKLGMGLSMLLGQDNNNNFGSNPEQNQSDQSFVHLDVKRIAPNDSQPRKHFDEEKLNELSRSIEEYGVLQPILVRESPLDGKYIIVAGERRYRASLKAKLTSVPVIILTKDDERWFQQALIENIQRENLNIVEEANAYKVIINDLNCTHEELAAKIGKSRSEISNKIRILALPQVVLECLRSESIAFGHAKVLLSVENPIDYCDLIISEKLSVRQLEALIEQDAIVNSEKIAAWQNNKSQSELDLSIDKQILKDIESGLRQIANLNVSLKMKKNGTGNINIKFHSVAELQEIIKYCFNKYDK